VLASRFCQQLVWLETPSAKQNTNKTELSELLWPWSATNLTKLSSVDIVIQVGPDIISPYTVVRDLRVIFDSELKLKSHIS
jgi:hypothetical protein